ncbi:MAG: alpha/beta hydrolase [Rickettsiaceae bacterium]|nr:MAG: alpha/beta hydrolase [Rickettsiaceae bacterium]
MSVNNNYILIHGAWHGNWIWRDIITIINKYGNNKIWAPNLPGHGNNKIENFTNITLSVYVNNIIGLIKQLNLDLVVLRKLSKYFIIIVMIKTLNMH